MIVIFVIFQQDREKMLVQFMNYILNRLVLTASLAGTN